MHGHAIPNWLILALTGAFYIFAFAMGWSQAEIVGHTLTGIVSLVLLMAISFCGLGVGLGALKLTAVGFLWFGTSGGFLFVALAYGALGLTGGLIGLLKRREVVMPFLPFAALSAVFIIAINADVLSAIA